MWRNTMTIDKSENLSSKKEMEGKEKNLVVENKSRVMSQVVEQSQKIAYYGACQQTMEEPISYDGISGLEFIISLPKDVCDYLSAINELFNLQYRSVADIIQENILDSIRSFIESQCETQQNFLNKIEKSLEEFTKILAKLAFTQKDPNNE